MTSMLEVESLTKRFGGLTAVNEVSFSLKAGEIFGIIGPNGAGKTTLFNLIAGSFLPTSGRVAFDRQDITARSSDWIGRRGIGRTFQGVHVFQEHSVRENLRRAEMIARRYNPFSYFQGKDRRSAPDVADMARFVGLGERLDAPAGGLAYGLQKILGVGMAMMAVPKLLLMDEPVAGLNPSEKQAAGQLIQRLRDERGISVLIVEHDMPLVMGICGRILVVNQGKSIALGSPEQIKSDPQVIDAYLGEDYEFA